MAGRKKAASSEAPSDEISAADTANGERGTITTDTTGTTGTTATQPSTVPVTFHRVAHDAGSVALVGEFNGWEPSSHLMVRDGQVFAITVELEAGRRHRYRFVVDGHRWEEDPTATVHEENPYGSHDSVVDLSDRHPGQPVI